jgi:hypothetical protein
MRLHLPQILYFVYYLNAMLKRLSKTLFTNYLCSFFVSFVLNFIYYLIHAKSTGYDFGHVIPLLIAGEFFINLVLLFMSAPVLFLVNPQMWDKIIVRVILYFSGPVVFIFACLSANLRSGDIEVYLLTGLVFLIIHTIFYRKLMRQSCQ